MGKGDGSDFKVKIIVRKELVFQCMCAKQQNCKVGDTRSSGYTNSCSEWATSFLMFLFKVFPDMGSNAVLISLEDVPVVEGDVKVMFDSSAVSTSLYICDPFKLHTVFRENLCLA